MTINLENLSEEELLVLNEQVVAKIKELRNQKNTQQISQFKLGDMISFAYKGKKVQGIIFRINQKSISILTASNERLSLSPGLVMKEKRPNEKIKTLQALLFPSSSFSYNTKDKEKKDTNKQKIVT